MIFNNHKKLIQIHHFHQASTNTINNNQNKTKLKCNPIQVLSVTSKYKNNPIFFKSNLQDKKYHSIGSPNKHYVQKYRQKLIDKQNQKSFCNSKNKSILFLQKLGTSAKIKITQQPLSHHTKNYRQNYYHINRNNDLSNYYNQLTSFSLDQCQAQRKRNSQPHFSNNISCKQNSTLFKQLKSQRTYMKTLGQNQTRSKEIIIKKPYSNFNEKQFRSYSHNYSFDEDQKYEINNNSNINNLNQKDPTKIKLLLQSKRQNKTNTINCFNNLQSQNRSNKMSLSCQGNKIINSNKKKCNFTYNSQQKNYQRQKNSKEAQLANTFHTHNKQMSVMNSLNQSRCFQHNPLKQIKLIESYRQYYNEYPENFSYAKQDNLSNEKFIFQSSKKNTQLYKKIEQMSEKESFQNQIEQNQKSITSFDYEQYPSKHKTQRSQYQYNQQSHNKRNTDEFEMNFNKKSFLKKSTQIRTLGQSKNKKTSIKLIDSKLTTQKNICNTTNKRPLIETIREMMTHTLFQQVQTVISKRTNSSIQYSLLQNDRKQNIITLLDKNKLIIQESILRKSLSLKFEFDAIKIKRNFINLVNKNDYSVKLHQSSISLKYNKNQIKQTHKLFLARQRMSGLIVSIKQFHLTQNLQQINQQSKVQQQLDKTVFQNNEKNLNMLRCYRRQINIQNNSYIFINQPYIMTLKQELQVIKKTICNKITFSSNKDTQNNKISDIRQQNNNNRFKRNINIQMVHSQILGNQDRFNLVSGINDQNKHNLKYKLNSQTLQNYSLFQKQVQSIRLKVNQKLYHTLNHLINNSGFIIYDISIKDIVKVLDGYKFSNLIVKKDKSLDKQGKTAEELLIDLDRKIIDFFESYQTQNN